MNYRKINLSIINHNDQLDQNEKNRNLYKYLIGNNVAYYYSKILSGNKNRYERKIISTGDLFNKEYIKTLKLLDSISNKNKIPFLLFKTYKYINEAVDGDIDIIIKEKDFYKFLRELSKEGFSCIEESPLKAICKKNGFKKIEPRVNIAFHGFTVLGESEIWKHTEEVLVDKIKVKKTTMSFDLFSFLLNVLYGPAYLKLYFYLLYKEIGRENLCSIATNTVVESDIDFIIKEFFNENKINKRFPLFLDNFNFLKWWYFKILRNDSFNIKNKVKHAVFFFYIKYKYIFLNKLEFAHKWI